jgi:DNA-binding PadR family transcriptional regulator
MARPPELSTTSFAILGLLAIRPWSSYELTQQMGRGMSRFWPRAASKLYEEPKKLVAQGLARASAASAGRRRRTVYTITAAGRRALASWLASWPAPPELECEALLRTFFAEHGTKRDLMEALAATRQWAGEQRAVNGAVARGYLEGSGPFPERLAHLLLVGRFLADFEEMVDRWASWALDVVAAWPEDVEGAKVDLDLLHALAARGTAQP